MTRTYSTEDLDHSAYKPLIQTATIVIATSTTVSSAIDLGGAHLFAIGTPAALTGSTMTFQISADGSTYKALYDEYNTQYSISVGASRVIFLDPTKFAAFRYIKLVSGSAEAADRSFDLFTRTI